MREDVRDIVGCPRCHAPLSSASREPAALVCASAGCALSNAAFPIVAGCPVLIDFEDSIVQQAALEARMGASSIARSTGWTARLRDLLIGGNTVAAANCQAFVDELRGKSANPRILVIGGGLKGAGTDALYDTPGIRLIATDIFASEIVDVVADAHRLPFASGSFDGVWIQAVLEHVLEPHRVAEEIHRVLGPLGLVYAETPFMQQVHEAAYDFTRFTRNGHRWLFRRFEEVRSGNVGGAAQSLLWSMRYFVRTFTRSHTLGIVGAAPFFWLRYVDRFSNDRWASDAACGVFFLGRRSERRLSPRDMITYYPGPDRSALRRPAYGQRQQG